MSAAPRPHQVASAQPRSTDMSENNMTCELQCASRLQGALLENSWNTQTQPDRPTRTLTPKPRTQLPSPNSLHPYNEVLRVYLQMPVADSKVEKWLEGLVRAHERLVDVAGCIFATADRQAINVFNNATALLIDVIEALS